MLQKSILKDKALVEVFKTVLAAVNPVQGIVGKFLFSFMKMYIQSHVLVLIIWLCILAI